MSLLLPGVGQLYLGRKAEGWCILWPALGIYVGIGFSLFGPAATRSMLSAIFLAVTHVFILLPALIDAWREPGSGATRLLSGESVGYVIFLLFMVGPMALPILWSSPSIPRLAKGLLTVFVLGVALVAVVFLVLVGPYLEVWLAELYGF